MPQFMIVYLGGNPPATPDEGKQHFAKYQAWLASLGSAAVSPMNPIKNTHRISPTGEISQPGESGMSGYTVVEAESIDAATAMAKDCPFLDIGGSLEVSEMVQMG